MRSSSRSARFVLASAIAACGGRTAADGPIAQESLLGTWHLTTERRDDRPTPGIHLSLAVDSVAGKAFYGRLRSYFAGDVGIDPGAYRPFTGEMSPLGAVHLVIEPARPSALPLGITGHLAGDSIVLAALTIGRDTLRGRRMILMRERDR